MIAGVFIYLALTLVSIAMSLRTTISNKCYERVSLVAAIGVSLIFLVWFTLLLILRFNH